MSTRQQGRLQAFDEIVSIHFDLGLTVEVKARIVIYPTDQIYVWGVLQNDHVSGVWSMFAWGGFYLGVFGDARHEHRKTTLVGPEHDPPAIV